MALLILVAPAVRAGCQQPVSDDKQTQLITNTTLSGVLVVTAWGIGNWDYFSHDPHARSEGWFGRNTKEGGADKLGHLYTTFVASQGISALYEHWCFDRDDAAKYGALTSFTVLGVMELGDSFSDYGFSYEDIIANTVGSVASLYRYQYPQLARKVDLRWEMGIHPEKFDITTDYNNSKYLLALKLGGFDSLNNSFLKYFEIHAGYFARGYGDDDKPDERTVYMAIGLNFTDLFRRNGYKRTATVLNYIQVPGSYIPVENNLDD